MTRLFRAGTSGNGNSARTAARWSFDSGSRGRCSLLRAEMLRFPSSTSGQLGADAIAHAALLDRVVLRRQIRQLRQDRAQCGTVIAALERDLEVGQQPRQTATLLDQVIELGVAARNRRRIAANLVGKRRPDACEPALKLARQSFEAV